MKNIGVLIYTYNRTDDAKINMEIIRKNWEGEGFFSDVKIVHAFNGEKMWYREKYLEDEFVSLKNTWHFQGASDLIDAGIKMFQKKFKKIEYVIVLASDTWLIKPAYVENLISKMKKDNLHLATCPWGLPERNEIRDVGMAVDLFVVDLKWATKYKMFPIDYAEFYKKYEDLLLYQKAGNVMLEKLLLAKYFKAISRSEGYGGVAMAKSLEKLLIIKDREPVHSHKSEDGDWIRNMYWPKMGLLTHHEPLPKKIILQKNNITKK